MIRLPRLTSRQILIVLHDLVATAAAIVVTFLMRFEDAALNERLHGLVLFLPFFLIYAAVVYFIIGLHRNKWRFTSIPDLYNLFRASTVLAISLLALDYILVAPNISTAHSFSAKSPFCSTGFCRCFSWVACGSSTVTSTMRERSSA